MLSNDIFYFLIPKVLIIYHFYHPPPEFYSWLTWHDGENVNAWPSILIYKLWWLQSIFTGAPPEPIKCRFRRYFFGLFQHFSCISLLSYRRKLLSILPRRYFFGLFQHFPQITVPSYRRKLLNLLPRRYFFGLFHLFSWITVPSHRRKLLNLRPRRYSIAMFQYICKKKTGAVISGCSCVLFLNIYS